MASRIKSPRLYTVNPPIRDILAIPLRLPQAVTTATKGEELEVITAMGAGSWIRSINVFIWVIAAAEQQR